MRAVTLTCLLSSVVLPSSGYEEKSPLSTGDCPEGWLDGGSVNMGWVAFAAFTDLCETVISQTIFLVTKVSSDEHRL